MYNLPKQKKVLFSIKTLFFISVFFGSYLGHTQEILARSPLIVGSKVTIHSEVLSESRLLNIYLPEGYEEDSLATYPVIYLLDGGMDEDFLHVAGIVQFGSFSWINMVPRSIVVGIANVDRKRDFTFHSEKKEYRKDFPTMGHSDAFMQFIQDELQPFVEKEYRTTSEKTIIGQSLGGLFATEVLFTQPNLFDHYVIVSPSLWWDDGSLLKRDLPTFTAEKSVFVAVGKEGKVMERDALALYDKLSSGAKKNAKLYYDFLAEQNHGDALHLAVYHALEKIFAEEKK